MKLLKGLFISLVLSFVFAATQVKAVSWTLGFYDISIPALQSIWTSAYETKDNSDYQYIYTVNAADPKLENQRAVQARTRELTYNTYSSWKDAPGQTYTTWGTQNNGYGHYRLELKNKDFTLNKTRYWGVWSW